MEPYIKGNISDITYLAELTPHLEIHSYVYMPAGCGVNSHNNLLTLHVRKLCAH